MLTAVASVLIFSMAILIHELGHFWAARKAGINVSEFSIGMGPVLFQKKGKETIYYIKALPIGGYIKMEGEDEEAISERSFSSKSPWQRFRVILMGPIMNFALALIIFFVVVLAYGIAGTTVDYIDENTTEYAAGLRPGDKIIKIEDTKVRYWEDLTNEIIKHEDQYSLTVVRDNVEQTFQIQQNYRYIVGISPTEADGAYTTELAVVNVGYPAENAGLKPGDKILSINGVTTVTWEEVRSNIANSGGVNLIVEFERDNQIQTVEVIPENQITIGFYTEMDKSILTAVTGSIHRVIFYITLMFQLIGMMITGQVGSEAVAGPIGIISMVGEAARLGLYPLLNLMAFININLGFINLMPVPALDGSRLVFIAIEGIRGKRISPEKEGYIHFIGFVFLMALMFFVLYKDIIKILN